MVWLRYLGSKKIRKLDWRDGEGKGRRRQGILLCNGLINLNVNPMKILFKNALFSLTKAFLIEKILISLPNIFQTRPAYLDHARPFSV